MRSIRSLLLFFILSLYLGTSFAAFSADSFITSFQAKQATLSLAEKKPYYLQVYNNLTLLAIKNRNDAEQANLYAFLKEYILSQIKNLSSLPASNTSSNANSNTSSSTISFTIQTAPVSEMNIPNVDLASVRDARLALHNTERKIKGLTLFTYSSALESTASTRAQHLADIGKANHLRKSSDGYYSYTSIKEWFIDQGITFADKEKNGQPLFTENLGRGYYTCTKTDCTDDFIKKIRTSRTFFMSEKGKSYRPHYNAIVGNFSVLGLGVSLVGNKYYLVVHYTQPLQ